MIYVKVVLVVVLAALAVAMLAALVGWFRDRDGRAARRPSSLQRVDAQPDWNVTTHGGQRMLRDRSGSGAMWDAGSDWDRHFGVNDR